MIVVYWRFFSMGGLVDSISLGAVLAPFDLLIETRDKKGWVVWLSRLGCIEE